MTETRVVRPAVMTMCGHGERAVAAACLPDRAGVAVLPGGPPEWPQVTGLPLGGGG